ncbi:high osmolarity glycerol pathway protein Nbp2, putative [Talaromyces stipitatus ATCC 10500]|uniref:High osmolarity glycerol pathway protein Nbp2, putative n=1 Tax=Talaromyces stipitatus (strain ATCC 10500 / CBS 375.48 / QM 6759 / NRRL 1006) TaxID=441959 RepID=B8M8E8_TALSN|nr:high osmolarity glycerol pathway protein Nbp2, putative [Talaromyces stipitatus ATCC 10500]EED20461.1 high osmolarity glycerol pathway protein Nbp2, putative [Talaromyces stipitatus ATCC 10500]
MATATTTSPQLNATGSRAVNPALPPVATDTPSRLPPMRRISSSARERLSVYSNVSQTSQHRSRPVSHVFPLFHSSLPYTLVRDFAYPPIHPLHYGPLPVPSRASTPASESRRLSDPQIGLWEPSRHSWSSNSGASDSHGQQLPAVSFGDGPPYSEDEDLHSPIITSRYRKHKSVHTFGDTGRGFGDSGRAGGVLNSQSDRGTLVAVNGDGSETYYVQGDQDASDGPGGEYITYPAGESSYSQYAYGNYGGTGVGAGGEGTQGSGHDGGDYVYEDDYSDRYSRDYHFSIGSPDEEMHGKAVALFDFTREHENELPLKEGQVILVSYRHGQGWLVAEDPRTGESGLVPEEFVRLVRDIEGGLSSLNGALSSGPNEAQSNNTITTGSSNTAGETTPTNGNNQGEILEERTEEKSS